MVSCGAAFHTACEHAEGVVLTAVMLRHLPPPAGEQCAQEMPRILKLGGRVLAVISPHLRSRKASFAGSTVTWLKRALAPLDK